MKKILIVGALALSVAVSMVSGTMATYTKTVDPLNGTVTAKYFNIENSSATEVNADLAPGEKTTWDFSVRNYSGTDTTEVNMDLILDLHVGNTEMFGMENNVLEGLEVKLYDSEDLDTNLIDTINSSGRQGVTVKDAFKANVASEKTYKIVLDWTGGDQYTQLADSLEKASTPIKLYINGTQSSQN